MDRAGCRVAERHRNLKVAKHRALPVPAKHEPGAERLERRRRPLLADEWRRVGHDQRDALVWPLRQVEMAAVPLVAQTQRRRLALYPDALS